MAKKTSELDQYKAKVSQRLEELTEVLAHVSVGDFSKTLKIPKKEDEFTDTYVGVQLLLDVIRDNLSQLQQVNTALSENVRSVEATNRTVEQEKIIDEAILDSIGEGLIVTDTDVRVTIVNHQATLMLGLTAKELVGKNLFKQVRAFDMNGQPVPDELRPATLALKKKRKVTHTGLYFATKRVKELSVAITASPIIVGQSVIGVVSVFRDVTQEREIDRAKTEVVSFTSHQLRTPLSVINWYTEVILGNHLGEVTDRQREYLEVILFTTRRMIELVNTFLSVSRIQLGTLVMDVKPINLQEVIESVHVELAQPIDQKRITFTADFTDDLPTITGDPKLIRVVFQNLINNAVKYTPNKGYVSVATSLIRPEDKLPVEEGVLVVIEDTGYGIPKKQHSKIFTKLFRAENAQQIDTEGAGLGLYMVKSIVNYAGGDVWFKSRLGKGTTFFVALPFVPAVRGTKPA